ncbi:MAG: hydroxymethylglutaryl-CoA lyase [Bacteroidetes bacterium]|nr:hydroxymethylglutaryl-CoA lyase [Bacteroidota bacterium]
MNTKNLQIVECPRDAFQGIATFIPTQQKIAYYNALLQVGFHTLDFGSFVSKKAVPQMADTPDVVNGLIKGESITKLLVIVAGISGAKEALNNKTIDVLGYPFSISPTFQLKNTRQNLSESSITVSLINEACKQARKELVVYLSMSFGNPYGDPYNYKMVLDQIEAQLKLGANVIALADTVGLASPQQVYELTSAAIKTFPEASIGLHLHGDNNSWEGKVKAGFDAGCIRFDGALGGFGGCPFTGSERVGNLDTLQLFNWFEQQKVKTTIDPEQLLKCATIAQQLFS